ncbi:DUF86 domain-containing protein [bacterium]|nr:DUF86 domain-containing protein [bacterium]
MDRDDAYLMHVLIAARKILEKTASITYEQFLEDENLQDSVVLQIAIIGEAARKISNVVKEQNPGIPWHEIMSMRNRLIHEYNRIDMSRVRETARHDIPAFVRQVEPLVPPEEES